MLVGVSKLWMPWYINGSLMDTLRLLDWNTLLLLYIEGMTIYCKTNCFILSNVVQCPTKTKWDKHDTDFWTPTYLSLQTYANSSIFALLHTYRHTHTHCANTCCAAQEDHSISIHEKSGLSFCSQPNLAARSPSALPSAGLSAACLEVNSFMIPLSVLPIFKWLILPLWQRLARPVAQRPPSFF